MAEASGGLGDDTVTLAPEERESTHQHGCPECGETWEHRTRRCEAAEELECDACRLKGETEEDVPF